MTLDDLGTVPRIGWVTEPSPITPLPELAADLGLAYLGVKRDDCISALFGGSKVRKLDYLLAAPPFSEAKVWAAMGAIGSGQLVAATAAAEALDRRLDAHMFWEPISAGVIDNLAYVASGPTSIHYYPSRLSMVVRHHGSLTSRVVEGAAMMPPGVTCPRSMVGIVRGALELGEQIERGEVPEIDEIYVAYGTGGTVAGLAVGLGMAGIQATVRAVAVVERVFATDRRLHQLERELLQWLRDRGVEVAEPAPVIVERGQLGPGYGVVSPASLAACERLADHGLRLEPIYTGKAMAALLARGTSGKVLFWNTLRSDPLPIADDWEARLPKSLAARLDESPRPTRRKFLLGAAAVLVLGTGYRCTGYATADFEPVVLWDSEVAVLRALSEVMLAPSAGPAEIAAVPEHVDRYLQAMPAATIQELHAAFVLVEQGTTLLGVSLSRLSRADVATRERHLEALATGPEPLRQAYRGMRDLCMLGYYQQRASWEGIDYEGPLLRAEETAEARRKLWPAYEKMRAPAGALPAGAR